MYALEAESAVAPLAVEVRMLVVNAAVAVVGADVVLQRAAPVVNGMNEFAQQKDGERARYCALVNRWQQPLELRQGDRLVATEHRPQYEQPRSRRLYAAMLQLVYIEILVNHDVAKIRKISGITSKNGRNDAKRLNIRVVTVSNDDKPKIGKRKEKRI